MKMDLSIFLDSEFLDFGVMKFLEYKENYIRSLKAILQ